MYLDQAHAWLRLRDPGLQDLQGQKCCRFKLSCWDRRSPGNQAESSVTCVAATSVLHMGLRPQHQCLGRGHVEWDTPLQTTESQAAPHILRAYDLSQPLPVARSRDPQQVPALFCQL